jgi:glutathione S-transferase
MEPANMITLYGTPATRTRRNLWLLEELGIPYSFVRVAPREETSRSSEYRAMNPMGKVPTLVDGELTLTESLAINLYLARRYGKHWWPAEITDEARLLQWTFFAATELDPLFFTLIYERLLKPEGARIEAAAEQAMQMLARPFAVLDAGLADSAFLAGREFSLADLNVAAVCTMGRRVGFDFDAYPHARSWLDRCWARPAFAKIDTMS